jgi:eukaryotic-like serine/threonine-protein kinase
LGIVVERAATTTDTTRMPVPINSGPLAPGHTVAGKYVVTRVVGGGGMGQVVAAMHVDLEQEVAIKIMLPERASGAESVERFLREARAASLLKSLHIARVFDVGKTASGLPYIVMELLHGEDLVDVLSRGPLPSTAATDAIIQACDAVAEAHAAGIIHRDLKPENLFLTRRRDGTPCVKVLDFGISKIAETTARSRGRLVTEENTLLGSPSYMSPEQVKRSSSVDARSDIWSLGVTLYELVTARDPFGAETAAEIFVNILTRSPPSPSMVNRAVPPGLSSVIMRCLEKDPAARFQTVDALAAALVPHASATQVDAVPSSGRQLTIATPGSLAELAAQPRYHPPSSGAIDSAPLSSPRPVATTVFASPAPKRGWIAPTISVLASLAVVGVIGIVLFVREQHHVPVANGPEAATTTTTPPPPAIVDPPSASAPVIASAPPAHSAPLPSPTNITTHGPVSKGAPPPRAVMKPVAPSSPPRSPTTSSAIPRERTSW